MRDRIKNPKLERAEKKLTVLDIYYLRHIDTIYNDDSRDHAAHFLLFSSLQFYESIQHDDPILFVHVYGVMVLIFRL